MLGISSPFALPAVGLYPVAAADSLFLEIQSFRVALLQDMDVLETTRAQARERLGLASNGSVDVLGLASEYPRRNRTSIAQGMFPAGMTHEKIYAALEKARDKDQPLPYYSPPKGVLPLWDRLRGDYYAEKIMKAKGPAEWDSIGRKSAAAYSKAGLFQMAGDILVVAGAHVRLFSFEEEARHLFSEAAEYYLEGNLHGHAAYTFFVAEDFARAALEAAFLFDHPLPKDEILFSPEILLTLAVRGMEEQGAKLDDAAFSNLLAVLQRAYAYELLAKGLPMLAVLHFLDAAANALAGGQQETAERALHQVEEVNSREAALRGRLHPALLVEGAT